ncbi:MAG: polysaccharide biosynthesis/export family protein [Acidobacteria bacterium]|nr:polysaccharide biosynthesis/export family protein [Acidobacteriota bacterium]
MMKLLLLLLCSAVVWGQQETDERSTYVLGPGDQILVRVLDMEEMSKEAFQIDMRGNVNLPMVGRIQAKGMTVEQLEEAIATRLKSFIKQPDVSVTLHEMRSQPVSVLGSVRNPGVHQLQGQKSLLEVLSLAGGLQPEAGYSVRIARRKEWGPIPLPGARLDDTGQYWVAEVGVKEIMEARSPEKNIPVKPQDVVTVPKGQMVYVMGAVKKSGGFVLGEKEKTTVLEALSMAEGCDNFAKRGGAKILRKTDNPDKRLEIALDLSKILDGKQKDVQMEQDDILFVPISGTKKVMARSAEAAIGIGTGLAIYRR